MQTNNTSEKNNGINVIDLFMYLLSKWRWFVISLLVFAGIAWLVYASRPFVYFSSATVIIKDPSNKTTTAGLDRYDNFINKVNVANEILQFRSSKLFREVVQRVHADVSYKIDDKFRQLELYTQTPFSVNFVDVLPTNVAVCFMFVQQGVLHCSIHSLPIHSIITIALVFAHIPD